ncbi:MAG: DNA polymerase III subunit gamma/tau [Anaerovorax sp.]|nr:DNA polymerase III subunit gamma/tau [Anaerovorax sp.]
MYQALYRSFRPETFQDILGQEHIVRILKNQINGNSTSHAYLFCGTRGTGKTSTARILAKGVNCLATQGERPCGSCENCKSITNGTFMDVIEIDAASNNGVENIRELRESVKYPPVSGRCKVYIIDEVHMLSTGAFNALLKTLEEPPENIMFILATTEVQKLPATILSRCLRLDFHRVPEKQLSAGMREICNSLGIEITDGALGLIASNADGSVRDGLSLLEQCIAGGEQSVERQDVLTVLGSSGEETFLEITDCVIHHNVSEALLLLNRILEEGKEVRQFMKDWISHYRCLLLTKYIKNPEDMLNMSMENVERIRSQSDTLDLFTIDQSIITLSKALNDARWSTQPRILLELCIIKLASGEFFHQNENGHKVSNEIKVGAVESAQNSVPIKTVQERTTPEILTQEKPLQEKIKQERPSQNKSMIHLNTNCDLSKLWQSMFTDPNVVKGSFHLLKRGTSLREVSEDCFIVEVSNELLKKCALENAEQLEMLMEKNTGKRLRMECVLSTHIESKAEDQVDKLANAIGKRLGLNIDIK